MLYANLGVRGLKTRTIRDTQLDRAVAMKPDLATVVSGTNDMMGFRFDANAFRADVEAMQRAMRDVGATVLTFTLPDVSKLMPIARPFRARLYRMNDVLRDVSARTGTILVDFAAHPAATDPRFWSDDRLHANSLGHERMAEALAHAIGLPGAEPSWTRGLEPATKPRVKDVVAAELAWSRRHLAPWLLRRLRGASSGDGLVAKRPQLTPLSGQLSVPPW